MNRRQFFSLGVIGAGQIKPSDITKNPKCPNCSYNSNKPNAMKPDRYLVPFVNLVQNEGGGRLTVEREFRGVVQLLFCPKCHTGYEDAGDKPKG